MRYRLVFDEGHKRLDMTTMHESKQGVLHQEWRPMLHVESEDPAVVAGALRALADRLEEM